jgi:hypothetical protein
VLACGCSTGPESSARVATWPWNGFSSTVAAAPTSASYSCWPMPFPASCFRSYTSMSVKNGFT